VLEWWEAAQADPEHVLFLRYEDIMKNPRENIKKIADFAGIEYTPEIIEKVRLTDAMAKIFNFVGSS